MSALDELDRYYTPPALADAALQWAHEVCPGPASPMVYVEPCAGGGAFGQAARRRWPDVALLGCDLDPEAPSVARADAVCMSVLDPRWADYLVGLPMGGARWTIIGTNPPYSILDDVIPALLDVQRRLHERRCDAAILLLLRETALSHLCDSATPPDAIGLSPIRPAFEGPAGDKLLAEAQRKAGARIAETHARRLAEVREDLAELDSQIAHCLVVGWGATSRQRLEASRMKALARLSELEAAAPRSAAVTAYGSDSCGSALALWRPYGWTTPRHRVWHPVPRWREKGARS